MRIHMKNWIFIPLAVLAVAFAGCSDDDDSSKSVEPTGAATPITVDNAGEAQAAVTTVIGQAAAKGPGTHSGAVSGKVKVDIALGKLAQIDIGDLGGLGAGAAVAFSMDFDNYSDDEINWLDGKVNYSFDAATSSLSYTIDLTIDGAYSGDIEGEVSVNNGVAGGFWVVDGQTINF
ncbi:MAG: hypothetical protein ACI906_000583 [Candidatus Latescibacterota bacterium]|jgi:hypothetical protein